MSSLSRRTVSPGRVLSRKSVLSANTVFYAGAIVGLLASTAPAAAGDWCGFRIKSDSVVDCGYSTYAECRDRISDKTAICIPDPDYAALPARRHRLAG